MANAKVGSLNQIGDLLDLVIRVVTSMLITLLYINTKLSSTKMC